MFKYGLVEGGNTCSCLLKGKKCTSDSWSLIKLEQIKTSIKTFIKQHILQPCFNFMYWCLMNDASSFLLAKIYDKTFNFQVIQQILFNAISTLWAHTTTRYEYDEVRSLIYTCTLKIK